MWYLTSENDNRTLYTIRDGKEVIIGRSVDPDVCNFGIVDDPSISRKHAILSVSHNKLYLQDTGSRYGTFINNSNEKVECDSPIQLSVNDIIKFGKMNSVWKVHQLDLVTCTSTLKGENLHNLKDTLGKIGAVLKNDWDESCRYLTMPSLTLTIKVVLALVQGSHIVTTAFWDKCLEAIMNNTSLPDPNNFTPEIVESTLNKENVSFIPNKNRKILFSGKNIIFFSKRQMDMYKTVLSNSSANALLLSESKYSKSSLCDENMIVIQYNSTSTSQEAQTQKAQMNDIVAYLKNKGKRVVADAEIGLAILYCSTEKYCNPSFNFSSEVVRQAPVPDPKSATVLAKESQDPKSESQKLKNVVIDETLISNNCATSGDSNKATSSKRKITEDIDDIQFNANKKLATNNYNKNDIESGKRKCSEDENSEFNPSKKLAIEQDDDFFNFKIPSETQNKSAEKKLNLSKPTKRKADFGGNDEEEIFNFVQEKRSATDSSNNSIFTSKEGEDNTEQSIMKKTVQNINEKDIAAMRGVKLKELMENNSKIFSNYVSVKKEITDDLDSKMKDLDLGTTIIIVNKDLIIKKEPLEIEEKTSQIRNFKKFKKVWPLKMQVTILSKSTINVN